ncbi:MAG: acyltransferase domain-containing protein [Clostridium sp.]|uniref:acyltransferase domain-containing protein n=1 Tax=Clostridium sp. TaxID=1506 RepID=UPI002FC7B6EB
MLNNAIKVYDDNTLLVNTYTLTVTGEQIKALCSEIGFNNEDTSSLLETYQYITLSQSALNIFKTYVTLYFNEDKNGLSGYFNISDLIKTNPDHLFLLVALYRACEIKSLYEDKGIDKDIYIDTMKDITVWANNHRLKYGVLGLSELHWLYYHLTLQLFRIGRLQFMRVEFNGDVKLFKQLATGFPLIMSYGDIKYDFLGNKTLDRSDFVSSYIESDVTITANPVREGKCLRDPLTINKCDYSLEIQNGTPLLDIHIPQGEPLNIKDSIDSMKKAVIFFYKHFNSWAVKGFTCKSWLLNPNYKYILSQESNIRKFASMFYHYPVISTDDQMYIRVFNGETSLESIKSSKSLSSLQVSIINGIEEGLDFSDSGIIFPSYDMKKLLHYTI